MTYLFYAYFFRGNDFNYGLFSGKLSLNFLASHRYKTIIQFKTFGSFWNLRGLKNSWGLLIYFLEFMSEKVPNAVWFPSPFWQVMITARTTSDVAWASTTQNQLTAWNRSFRSLSVCSFITSSTKWNNYSWRSTGSRTFIASTLTRMHGRDSE